MSFSCFRLLLLLGLITMSYTPWAHGQDSTAYRVFAPDEISLPDVIEGSPSVTADGQTLVFTRYQRYRTQVPYIAHRTDEGWQVERLPVADTVYNIAISPDGQQLFFKVAGADYSAQSYRVQKDSSGEWGTPRPLPGPLFKNAGYFRVARDGTLYMYINSANGNPRGIYYSEPQPDGSYGPPQWLSDAVSPYGSSTYSPVVNADETRLIVNRAGIPAYPGLEKLGPKGLHYHQQYDGQWDTGTRIEGIPYTFYAEVLPDDRLIFMYDRDLQVIDLAATNIEMTPTGRKRRIRAQLDSMEAAYARGDMDFIAFSYAPRGRILEQGALVARASYRLKRYWNDPEIVPIRWELTSYQITSDPEEIYQSERWQLLSTPPIKVEELDVNLPAGGLYQMGYSERTYRINGKEQIKRHPFLIYWTDFKGQPRIWVESR